MLVNRQQLALGRVAVICISDLPVAWVGAQGGMAVASAHIWLFGPVSNVGLDQRVRCWLVGGHRACTCVTQY